MSGERTRENGGGAIIFVGREQNKFLPFLLVNLKVASRHCSGNVDNNKAT